MPSAKSKLVLHKASPITISYNHNVHVSHTAHASHASHYSQQVVMSADSARSLSKQQINYIKKGLCETHKLNRNNIKILRAYKASAGRVHKEGYPIYGIENAIYIKFKANSTVYEYLIPMNKRTSYFKIVSCNKDYIKYKYDWMTKIEKQ